MNDQLGVADAQRKYADAERKYAEAQQRLDDVMAGRFGPSPSLSEFGYPTTGDGIGDVFYFVNVGGRVAIERPISRSRSTLFYLPSEEGYGLGESIEPRDDDLVDDLPRRRRYRLGSFGRVAVQRILKRIRRTEHVARGDVPYLSFKRSHFVHADESGTDTQGGAR